ncbi:unnamed protein product [Gongylonema pulchrum]|uniref:Tetraspanin n=1 Tax=Gongylonema pulchrum TaxID=637853 RepID=A0A3P7Q4H4_9BILA|nr:unnamed protein product [Gongylonema pulchrum]
MQLIGVTCLALGVYLCIKDPRPISEWADVFLNPAVMLTIIGLAMCIVSLMGSLGALRDNIVLLKTFALSVFFCYIVIVIFTFLLFILFYSDTTEGLSAHSILIYSIKNYHTNRNLADFVDYIQEQFALSVFFCYIVIVIFTFLLFILFYSDTTEGLSAHSILIYSIKNYHTNRNLADFVDYIQEQLECCGVSSASQGYRDWQISNQFNCNATNPYPEKCGVPFSCCKRSVVSEAAAGSTNPLLPAMRSLECWQNAQRKRPQELEADLHTRGCLQPLRILFESHAIHVGAAVAICMSVCLSNILAKQIDHQRYLLKREARRCERRRRRNERNRFRDPFVTAVTASDRKRSSGESRHAVGLTSENNANTAALGLESVKVPDTARAHGAAVTDKKLPIPNPVKLPTSPPPVPPHDPCTLNGDARPHRKHRRPNSSSPIRYVAQPRSAAVQQRISNGAPVVSGHNNSKHERKQRRRSLAAITPPKTAAESRTHQWVLEQSDLVGYEPIA